MTKPNLIIFGEDWGRHPSSTQHLALRLLPFYKITWVNSVGLRAPRFALKDITRIFQKLVSFTTKKTKTILPDGLSVVSLPALPFPASKLAAKINGMMWKKKLAYLENPILWASLPTAVSAVGSLNETSVVYYCGDDFGSLAGVDHTPVLELERELAIKSDFVFAASEHLTAKFPKAHHLPHGVDYLLFATPVERASDLPFGKPIAGFYGSISDWVDVDLMAETAIKMPHWNFVFVGEKRTDLTKLEALSNVFLLGERPHSALPSYVQHWQASLLPFKDNAQIRACNPLKLREYMAAGTPIVSTNFPALKPYVSLIHVGQDFTKQLETALNDTRNEQRQHMVREESWENRALTLHKLLQGAA